MKSRNKYTAGFNSTLRLGNVTHHEYIQVEYTSTPWILSAVSFRLHITLFQLLIAASFYRLEKEGMLG